MMSDADIMRQKQEKAELKRLEEDEENPSTREEGGYAKPVEKKAHWNETGEKIRQKPKKGEKSMGGMGPKTKKKR